MSGEHWLHSEQALIGAVLIDPPAYWRIADQVDASEFAGPGHAALWALIAQMQRDGQPVDTVTMMEVYRGSRDMRASVIELANNAPGSANIAAYAALVARNAEHRRIVAAGRAIAALAPGQADEAARLVAAACVPKSQSVRQIGDVLSAWYAELEAKYHAEAELTGIPTGLPLLDEATAGWQDEDLIIVAARPSMGKSAFAGQIAESAASRGHGTIIFTLEMSAKSFANRLVAARASIGIEALMSPKKIEDGGWHRMGPAVEHLKSLPLHFDDSASLTVDRIIAKSRQVHAQHGLRLVVIDYLQMIASANSKKNKNDELGDITRALKGLAKELKLPVILLSQLNRSLEQRADKRPILSDLRESGAIEQDADVVVMLYRDEYYNHDSHLKGYAEAIIRKHRNGKLCSVPMGAELQFCRFLHTDYLPDAPAEQSGRGGFGRRFGKSKEAA